MVWYDSINVLLDKGELIRIVDCSNVSRRLHRIMRKSTDLARVYAIVPTRK